MMNNAQAQQSQTNTIPELKEKIVAPADLRRSICCLANPRLIRKAKLAHTTKLNGRAAVTDSNLEMRNQLDCRG
jgi:hypothetical protein